ncbi:MAG: hypothetical protein JOY90_14675 [Bradyrhizobium sp.]|nr:hypothetical protein [Bradyrhizobium sp.]
MAHVRRIAGTLAPRDAQLAAEANAAERQDQAREASSGGFRSAHSTLAQSVGKPSPTQPDEIHSHTFMKISALYKRQLVIYVLTLLRRSEFESLVRYTAEPTIAEALDYGAKA